MDTSDDKVQIVTPYTTIFDSPIFNTGDNVSISGVATDDITLFINDTQYSLSVQDNKWNYLWDTSGFEPGVYSIKAECGISEDEILIKLIDVFPPNIIIDTPINGEIIDTGILTIEGVSYDNFVVDKVEVSIDNGDWRESIGTDSWSIDWNLSTYLIGDHIISARAYDSAGSVSYDVISIALNESGHNWLPQINSFYHMPDIPINVSNVIIYANVTSTSPFKIQKVVLHWNDGIETKSKEMFQYADNPVQDRHEEDPLKNQSNDPIFGLELGQFSTETNVNYWIEAFDTANNKNISSEKSFLIVDI